MTRLRITLLLLALGIAAPAALIVQRAVASRDLENRYRHEAVARRAFDEMERALSDFIVREEARPIEDYRRGGAEPFATAAEPFVLGWFVLGENGSARIVHAPRDAARALAAVDSTWTPAADLRDSARGLPAPGRTQRVGAKGEAESEAAEEDRASPYDVLSSLNKAQQRRDERKSRVGLASSPSPDPAYAQSASDAASYAARAQRAAPPDADAEVAAREFVAFESAGALEESVARTPALAPPSAEPAQAAKDELGTRPGIDPLIGRAGVDDTLVLIRSVWRSEGPLRQGVVVDRAALAAWLERSTLAGTALEGSARLDFGAPELPDHAPAEHRYVHRFAEPFDALIARLDIAPLPGIGGAGPIHALAGLLAAVGIVGLFAVQRGARVVVDYAQRRSDFVASVSHELKTPLTAIRMYGEMLRDGLVRSEAKRDEYYATIADESERLSRLIDNVLEFSRLEQDRRALEVVVGPLDEALRATCAKLRAHVEREGFQLRLEVEPGLPSVRYDRDALTQVVFNLVDNALKYARTSERRDVVIGLQRASGGVELCVRDFGPGVPTRSLRQVFEPFYRGGDELTRTAKGTGIGLALVRELATAMGASVRGDNAPGGGFEVALAFRAHTA